MLFLEKGCVGHLKTRVQAKCVLWAVACNIDKALQYSEQQNARIIWVILLGKRRLKNKLMVEKRPFEDSVQLFSCSENRMKGHEHKRAI